MDSETTTKLLTLNRQFYQNLGAQFSATRKRLQPGVQRILRKLPACDTILDLGCGNATLASELVHKGFSGLYFGLDFSAVLLAEIDPAVSRRASFRFLQADLTSPNWDEALMDATGGHIHRHFDLILAFAVLHHIPGDELRRNVLGKIRQLVAPHGRFIHSEWQFLNSPRLHSRIQPWEHLGLNDSHVDAGDYLLDWRAGGYGLRYAHHFTEAELDRLASQSDFAINETFYSDGEGGKLGLYQVWKPA